MQNGLLGKKLTAEEKRKISEGRKRARRRVERMGEGGRWGQSRHAELLATDPEYSEKFRAALSAAMTPERRADNGDRMRELQRRRYRCDDCGYVSTASNVSRHHKKTGHTNRSMIQI